MRPSAPMPPSGAVVITLSNSTSYTPDEELSFRHARHHLGRYDTYVLMPKSHQGIYPGLMPQRFADRYFGNPRAFESLMLSERFYRAFAAYEFILVYHLDAIVFSDRVPEWCRAGYDYIGAPGLSLRRVPACLRVLRSGHRQFLSRVLPRRDVPGHIRRAVRGHITEDQFWSEYAIHYHPEFRVAPVDAALRFAFEADPRSAFERTGGKMPFGARRWAATDRSFYQASLLRHGLGSEVRLRPSREARAWGEFEIDVARMSRVVPR
jgi:hypothetical protein